MARSLVRWEPMRDLVSLREAMDRLFEESFVQPWGRWFGAAEEGFLPVDVYETKDAVVVEASVPGVKPEDVDVSITGDTLTIKGETKSEKKVERENYIRQERRYGSFCRAVTLPEGLDRDKAEANFENGVLTITFPKSEEVKPKSIKVKVKK
ncbi:MAG: Hsp20/alpha crystallin family protein [Anaerolineae bacterium]|nr:Hsp20/alpha crystallin family protein [Anaerolineae bacterium]